MSAREDDPILTFYTENGYLKRTRRETGEERARRVQMALYGSQNFASGGLVEVLRKLANKAGKFQTSRAEQAADLVDTSKFDPRSFGKMFSDPGGGLFTTMPPSSFEDFARPLKQITQEQNPYPRWNDVPRRDVPKKPGEATFDAYLDNIANLINTRGLHDPPTLWLAPPTPSRAGGLGEIEGHEGRHRMRALDRMGQKDSLVRLAPANTGDARGSAEEAYARMMEKYFPEGGTDRYWPELGGRDPRAFPAAPFADGGAVKRLLKSFARSAEKGTETGSTKLPNQRLVVAREMPDGTIRYGSPGQIHADLVQPEEIAGRMFPLPDDVMGFAIPGGSFLSRQEAAEFVKRNEPGRAQYLHEPTGLQSEQYQRREGKRTPFAGGGAVDELAKLLGKLKPKGSGYVPPAGKPATVKIPGYGEVEARPLPEAMNAAESYMRRQGRGAHDIGNFVPLNEDYGRAVGSTFDAMPNAPHDPRVRRAYDALIDETMDQYRGLKDAGYDFRFNRPGEGDPHARSPSMGYADLVNNGRLSVFPTLEGFGSGIGDSSKNPLLIGVGKVGDLDNATANDAFRIVHDLYGHFGPGNPFFRAPGEERAYQLHSRMYGPEARRAAATETRGQNSWVNFGPQAVANRGASGADTIYAPQTVNLLPDWAQAIDPMWPYPGKPGYADGGEISASPETVPNMVTRGEIGAFANGGYV